MGHQELPGMEPVGPEAGRAGPPPRPHRRLAGTGGSRVPPPSASQSRRYLAGYRRSSILHHRRLENSGIYFPKETVQKSSFGFFKWNLPNPRIIRKNFGERRMNGAQQALNVWMLPPSTDHLKVSNCRLDDSNTKYLVGIVSLYLLRYSILKNIKLLNTGL